MKTNPIESGLWLLKTFVLIAIAAVLFFPAVLAWIFLLIREGVAWIGQNHERAAETARDVARGTVVVSKLAIFWAWLVAPTGLTAVAAATGITSTPVIVLVAPFLVALTGASLAVAAALELFSKRERTRSKRAE